MDIYAELETRLRNAMRLHKAELDAAGVDLADVAAEYRVVWADGDVSVSKVPVVSGDGGDVPGTVKRGKKYPPDLKTVQ